MNTIHNFSASLIQRTKQAGRYSTSGIYTSTVNSFFRFIGHRSITFADLTPSLIKQYEDRLLGEGRRHNTISTYMRMLRSISHQAAEQGIPFTHSIDDLFAYVFTGYEPTAKRAISPLLIRRLVNLDLEKKPALRFSIIRKSKFPQNPKRSVRFSGKRTKRSVQKRKARNTQKAETKVL